jgi:hypothetical protein
MRGRAEVGAAAPRITPVVARLARAGDHAHDPAEPLDQGIPDLAEGVRQASRSQPAATQGRTRSARRGRRRT